MSGDRVRSLIGSAKQKVEFPLIPYLSPDDSIRPRQ
jgi:hypothetical protein